MTISSVTNMNMIEFQNTLNQIHKIGKQIKIIPKNKDSRPNNLEKIYEIYISGSVISEISAGEAKDIRVDKNGNLRADDIKMHLLISGDRYNLKTRKVIK